jgi:hypothetical protein
MPASLARRCTRSWALNTSKGFNEARSIRDSVAEVEKKIQKVDYVEQKKMLETVRTAERLAKYCKEKWGSRAGRDAFNKAPLPGV